MSDNIRFGETGQATVFGRPWPLDLVITTHAATRKTKCVFLATHNERMICSNQSTVPGARGGVVVRHYATNRQIAGSIPHGVIGIFQ